MPLLNKKPLDLHKYNKKLRDDAEVFYCKSTNEIFEDYEEYCQRVISCNSLIWTCAITGKTNLTYEEALASEENALRTMKDFPMELRSPVLYIASITARSNFNDFIDDVFNFVKDRYFVGESVEACQDGEWIFSRILRVLMPSQEEIDEYCKKKEVKSPIDSRPFPSILYKYELEILDDGDEDGAGVITLPGEKIRRVKGFYSKEKNRVYLKQFAEFSKESSVWKIQENILSKYSISSIIFGNMFVGDPPIFKRKNFQMNSTSSSSSTSSTSSSLSSSFSSSSRYSQQSIRKFLLSKKSSSKSYYKPKPGVKRKSDGSGRKSLEDLSKLQKQYEDTIDKVIQQARRDAVRLEGRAKKSEELKKKREKQKAEKEKLAKFVREWERKRDDLECEDLKEFPPACPIKCRIPNEHFGEAVMIMEFLTSFRNELKIKDYFPFGVKFDLVERALVEKEVAGPFCDILQLLLTALFSLQEEEDDEIRSTNYQYAADLKVGENDDISMAEAIRLATIAATWSTIYHGAPLNKLSLDAITVSEILRLHLLSSGGRAADQSCKWRYQERGGYTSSDDPSLTLRIKEPHILKFLAVRSVAELPVADKIKVLNCLMNQILTYAELRDIIDDRYEKVRSLKSELKNEQVAETKRKKNESAQKLRERREAKESGKVVPEESEQDKTRGEREASRRRAEFSKRLEELKSAAMECQILPLGRDRGYRNYWIFSTMGGLFVEDGEKFPGRCLSEPTPENRTEVSLEEDTMAYVRKLFEEEMNCGSDKENEGDSSVAVSGNKKKHRSESSSGGGNPVSCSVSAKSGQEEDEPQESALVCTADEENCPVHGRKNRVSRWYFYYREADVDELINCLNKRGIREHRLRKILVEERDRICQRLSRCPVNQLNVCTKYVPKAAAQFATKFTRSCKGYENANLKYPSGTPVQEILELYIRELILDTEEKIYCGGLGALKVTDREAWRIAIEGRTYDRQDDSLLWNRRPPKKEKNPEKTKEGDASRPDTPSSVDSSGDQDVLTSRSDQNQTVKDLASAVLQIARSIEPKYLQKPLAADEKKKERWSPMERWESSLMSSTSYAQIYLHVATLENSVQWQKSVLNARCKICRRGGDGVNMLLCDGCNRGFHVYCLKPKLASIPEGDWFCRSCRPKEQSERKRKRSRRLFSEESDNEGTVEVAKEDENAFEDDDDEAEDNVSDGDDDDEDNEPLITVKLRRKSSKRISKKSDDDSSDEPLSKLVKSSRS